MHIYNELIVFGYIRKYELELEMQQQLQHQPQTHTRQIQKKYFRQVPMDLHRIILKYYVEYTKPNWEYVYEDSKQIRMPGYSRADHDVPSDIESLLIETTCDHKQQEPFIFLYSKSTVVSSQKFFKYDIDHKKFSPIRHSCPLKRVYGAVFCKKAQKIHFFGVGKHVGHHYSVNLKDFAQLVL